MKYAQYEDNEPDYNTQSEKPRGRRSGVFIGAYIPNKLREQIRQSAKANHRSVSQELIQVLWGHYNGPADPPAGPR